MAYDIAVIGAGVAGVFAALRLAERHKRAKVLLLDLGRPPAKRRRQLEGWLGCFPGSDGKIYPADLDKVSDLVPRRTARAAQRYFYRALEEAGALKLKEEKGPSKVVLERAAEAGFEVVTHSHFQWEPAQIHILSRLITDKITAVGNVELSFDNEVQSFARINDSFCVTTEEGDFNAERLILCPGRSGWRWANDQFRRLGLLAADDVMTAGVMAEIAAQHMGPFDASHCSFVKDTLSVGPLSWNGSVIQEDHEDFTTAAFRSNERRWKSERVFFRVLSRFPRKGEGTAQTDRLAKLAFLLANDRVGREKTRHLQRGTSPLLAVPEFGWLPEVLEEIEAIVPDVVRRGYFHFPAISTITSEINLGPNLETEMPGVFAAGETAGVRGVQAAALTGIVAADSAGRDL